MSRTAAAAPSRFASVDALRGLTVAAMLLVNNPGDWGHVYAPLLHAPWHGCTPTDLVFPFFLFIVGVSVALGVVPRVDAGHGRGALMRAIAMRADVPFAVLVEVEGLSDRPRFRIGVAA